MTRRGLHLDPSSGMAGDMFLGALVDLGLPLEELRRELAKLPLDGFRIETKEVMRGAIRATKLDVVVRKSDGREVIEGRDAGEVPTSRESGSEDGHGHGHAHVHPSDHEHGSEPGAGHGRSFREIVELMTASGLSEKTKRRALDVFETLAAAEARVHGIEVEAVHFHEVGAVDSIVDICGAAVALELLEIDEVTSSRVGLGTGVRRMAHGEIPIPVPATAEIIQGMPVRMTGVTDEMLTPTGAAILRCIVDEFEPRQERRFLAQGFGAGSTERADPPNVVRAMLYEIEDAVEGLTVVIDVLETQVDDMTPESLGYLRERLESAGCLDFVIQPVLMKKNRPGHLLTVLASPKDADALEELLFLESSTFGIRRRQSRRRVLERETVEIETPWGSARLKLGLLDGRVIRASPEHEDCARLALATKRPINEIRQLLLENWNSSR